MSSKPGRRGTNRARSIPRPPTRARSRQAPMNPRSRSSGRTVLAPVAVAQEQRSVGPRMMTASGGKSMRIKHSELILEGITGASSFTISNTYTINPGLALTFPWLAPQATQWQQYRVAALRVRYVPIAPTSTAGDIMLIPEYDVTNPAPVSETQASNNVGAVQMSVWAPLVLNLDVAAMGSFGNRRFIRSGNVLGDLKTFDVAKFYVASNNVAGGITIGKVWIDYDIEFFMPQSGPSLGSQPQQTSVFAQDTSTQVFTTATPQDVKLDVLRFDPLGWGPQQAIFTAFGWYNAPAGAYRVIFQAIVQDSVAELFTGTVQFVVGGVGTIATAAVSTGAATLGSTSLSIDLSDVVAMNGSQSFEVSMTLTGAAGTLKVTEAQLIVSMA